MPYLNIPVSKLGSATGLLVGKLQGKLLGSVQSKVSELRESFSNQCPPPSELQRVVAERNNIQKLLASYNSQISSLGRIPGTLTPIAQSLLAMVQVLKSLPIPQSMPPGFGIPVGITTTFADLLHKIKEFATQALEDAKSIEAVLKEAGDVETLIKTSLSSLDGPLQACSLEASLSSETKERLGLYENTREVVDGYPRNVRRSSFNRLARTLLNVDESGNLLTLDEKGMGTPVNPRLLTGDRTMPPKPPAFVLPPKVTSSAKGTANVSGSTGVLNTTSSANTAGSTNTINPVPPPAASSTGVNNTANITNAATTAPVTTAGIGTPPSVSLTGTNTTGIVSGISGREGSTSKENLLPPPYIPDTGTPVFRGPYNSLQVYIHTPERRDVVIGKDEKKYITNNPSKAGTNLWNSPSAKTDSVQGTTSGNQEKTPTVIMDWREFVDTELRKEGPTIGKAFIQGANGVMYTEGELRGAIDEFTVILERLNREKLSEKEQLTTEVLLNRLRAVDTIILPSASGPETYVTSAGEVYTLDIVELTTPAIAPRRYAIAKDTQGVIVVKGTASFSSSTDILMEELKFKLDNQLF